ncbi:MAG: tRNA 5-methoxyuridine(34)/uridine 5-oxyacetic acid(34) synthase CmoB [Gammaproteobacteria bacterium]|nr:tRNA 5-methoxyuridine(34)/uridine 5-oxyacetic acid(34) synthase CmoB [Gammaproteobacteria bacterium]
MISTNYETLYHLLQETALEPWLKTLPKLVDAAFAPSNHGDLEKWQTLLSQLPTITPSSIDLNASSIRIGESSDCDIDTRNQLEKILRQFHPWRKGPFNLFGLQIDTEWRSDWKWNRLKEHIEPLTDRRVIDIGCGSGYHCWRMVGAGAKQTIGIDPMLLFASQFNIMQHYINNPTVHLLPLGIEALPSNSRAFDTVFSMGVLYHRRSPFDHLFELRSLLRPNGQLVLETLVIDGSLGETIVPEKRYAKMRNVWFLPSTLTLESWLKRSGFKNIELIDITQTGVKEQRSTEWMQFESLTDFLNPSNPNLTIEGLPAPKRAIWLATAQ